MSPELPISIAARATAGLVAAFCIIFLVALVVLAVGMGAHNVTLANAALAVVEGSGAGIIIAFLMVGGFVAAMRMRRR